MSNQTNSYSSPLSNEMAQNIDNLNLPIIQKHHIRILAHCLEVLKEIANDDISFFEEEDLLREWCGRQSQEFQDERFNQIFYEQMSSAAKKLNKTEIIAPYAGRIQNVNIDLGTTIIPGQPVGAMYTSSEIEITLAVKDNDLQFLSIPMDGRKLNPSEQASVVIESFYKGKTQSWKGKLERVDGVIDPVTRMINLIAVFKNDFIESDKPNLPIGLFVEAKIDGITLKNIFEIPINSISEDNEVYIVDKDNQLELRELTILKKYSEFVIIKDGLKAGERIVTSKLSTASNGIKVNPVYK